MMDWEIKEISAEEDVAMDMPEPIDYKAYIETIVAEAGVSVEYVDMVDVFRNKWYVKIVGKILPAAIESMVEGLQLMGFYADPKRNKVLIDWALMEDLMPILYEQNLLKPTLLHEIGHIRHYNSTHPILFYICALQSAIPKMRTFKDGTVDCEAYYKTKLEAMANKFAGLNWTDLVAEEE